MINIVSDIWIVLLVCKKLVIKAIISVASLIKQCQNPECIIYKADTQLIQKNTLIVRKR